MAKVITANVLATGSVVFMTSDGRWVSQVDEAARFADDAAAAAHLERAAQDARKALIVDPFVTDVTAGAEGKPTMSLRDRIRAYGPTIDFTPADATGLRGS